MSTPTIHWWNAAAAEALPWAWRAALASLAVMTLLLAARPLLRRWVSSHAASWLWLLPLVPLVAPPFAIAHAPDPFPAPPAVLREAAEPTTLIGTTNVELNATPSPIGTAAARVAGTVAPVDVPGQDHEKGRTNAGSDGRPTAAVSEEPRLTRGAVGLLIWFAAAASGFALLALRLSRTAAMVRRATGRPDATFSARFDTLARHAGLESRARLRLTDELDSPATCGLLRPTVLVPTRLVDDLDGHGLDRASLDWILRHELAHARRRDVLVSVAVRAVRALWLLHPAAWIAPLLADRERELACDEAALAREPHADGPRAAAALLHVLEHRCSGRPTATGAVPLAHPESLERQRIMKLLDPAVRARRGIAPLPALGLVLTATALLTSGFRPLQAEPTPLQSVVVEPVEDATTAELAASTLPVRQNNPHANPFVREPVVREPQTRDRHTVVASALRYLIANQAEDGRWRATTKAGKGGAGEFDDVGTTANAILALLDAPEGHEISGLSRALARAIDWLRSTQDSESGAFIPNARTSYTNPSHARALSAWIAYHKSGLTPEGAKEWLEVATLAVRYIESARNPYMGWRYDYPPAGDNDSVITSWMLSALAAARGVGIEMDRSARHGGFTVLDEYFDPRTGRVGYSGRGVQTSRVSGKSEEFPGELVEFPTTTTMCAHLDWGASLMESDALIDSVTLIASRPPVWSIGEGTIDSYYWLFGTRAIQPLGGALVKRWNGKLETALLGHYDRDADGHVFWAAVDAWHFHGSEIGMTTMCVLALQAIEDGESN